MLPSSFQVCWVTFKNVINLSPNINNSSSSLNISNFCNRGHAVLALLFSFWRVIAHSPQVIVNLRIVCMYIYAFVPPGSLAKGLKYPLVASSSYFATFSHMKNCSCNYITPHCSKPLETIRSESCRHTHKAKKKWLKKREIEGTPGFELRRSDSLSNSQQSAY